MPVNIQEPDAAGVGSRLSQLDQAIEKAPEQAKALVVANRMAKRVEVILLTRMVIGFQVFQVQ